MQRFSFLNSQNTASVIGQTNQSSFSKSSLFIKLVSLLVFFMAVAGTVITIAQAQANNSNAVVPEPTSNGSATSTADSDLNIASESSIQSTDKSLPAPNSITVPADPLSNTVKVDSSIVNGQTNTTVEVNGSKVDIPQNSNSITTSIQNGNQSANSVNVQSTQSNGTSSSYGANISSSFSHSFVSSNSGEN